MEAGRGVVGAVVRLVVVGRLVVVEEGGFVYTGLT